MQFTNSELGLAKYMVMLKKEAKWGTSYYERHDLNEQYWNKTLGPVKDNPEFWENKVALDFGTGMGRNVNNLLSLSNWKSIYAVDISEKNITKCTETFPEKTKFRLSSGKDLKLFKDESIDFIVSTLVFKHLACHSLRFMLLKEIYRVMKPGAIFTFDMGAGQDLTERAYPKHWFCLMRTGGLVMPTELQVVDYKDNFYNATGSNGECDVRVLNTSDLELDLTKIGFKNIQIDRLPSYDDYIHTEWLYIQCEK